MSAFSFAHVQFIASAASYKQAPKLLDSKGEPLAQIAVVGRSNVGKSSLLNVLFRRKNLVKTSSTPGKTQLINFFAIPDQICFVDLPGYGFAKVPEQVRAKWGPMVQDYLTNSPNLKLIVFLFDIRRMPNEDDQQMMRWILHSQKPAILVLTKIDTVGKSVCQRSTAAILKALHVDADVVHFSATKNVGRRELLAAIRGCLNLAPEDVEGE